MKKSTPNDYGQCVSCFTAYFSSQIIKLTGEMYSEACLRTYNRDRVSFFGGVDGSRRGNEYLCEVCRLSV